MSFFLLISQFFCNPIQASKLKWLSINNDIKLIAIILNSLVEMKYEWISHNVFTFNTKLIIIIIKRRAVLVVWWGNKKMRTHFFHTPNVENFYWFFFLRGTFNIFLFPSSPPPPPSSYLLHFKCEKREQIQMNIKSCGREEKSQHKLKITSKKNERFSPHACQGTTTCDWFFSSSNPPRTTTTI